MRTQRGNSLRGLVNRYMTANASMPDPENHDRAFRARLNNEPLPGAIIDCATAEVLAANAGGLDALGLTAADRLPATLDSAMCFSDPSWYQNCTTPYRV